MAWQMNRKAELPADWDARRKRALDRDNHQCRWPMPNGGICGAWANQVDHIGDRHDHSMANLRSLCKWHHAKRTSAQGNAARKRVSQQRPPEKHPGIR